VVGKDWLNTQIEEPPALFSNKGPLRRLKRFPAQRFPLLHLFVNGPERHRRNEQNPAVLLSHVMAHEIAHLLLGTNSRSASGIMRAHWYHQELASADKGLLLFTPDQARTMTERLHQSMQNAGNASPLSISETKISEKSRK
jgi:hypothetical protein